MQPSKGLCLITVALLFCFFSCQETKTSLLNPAYLDPSQYTDEVKALTTLSLRQQYLENIMVLDQKVREDQEIITTYGHDSKEYQDFKKKAIKTDQELLAKIEAYLREFGFPDKFEYGDSAAIAPWIVLHHCGDIDIRNAYFEELYRAAKYGHLEWSSLTFFMQRTHKFKTGSFLDFNGTFTNAEELDALVTALGLDNIRKKVDDKFAEEMYK